MLKDQVIELGSLMSRGLLRRGFVVRLLALATIHRSDEKSRVNAGQISG